MDILYEILEMSKKGGLLNIIEMQIMHNSLFMDALYFAVFLNLKLLVIL